MTDLQRLALVVFRDIQTLSETKPLETLEERKTKNAQISSLQNIFFYIENINATKYDKSKEQCLSDFAGC